MLSKCKHFHSFKISKPKSEIVQVLIEVVLCHFLEKDSQQKNLKIHRLTDQKCLQEVNLEKFRDKDKIRRLQTRHSHSALLKVNLLRN